MKGQSLKVVGGVHELVARLPAEITGTQGRMAWWLRCAERHTVAGRCWAAQQHHQASGLGQQLRMQSVEEAGNEWGFLWWLRG